MRPNSINYLLSVIQNVLLLEVLLVMNNKLRKCILCTYYTLKDRIELFTKGKMETFLFGSLKDIRELGELRFFHEYRKKYGQIYETFVTW